MGMILQFRWPTEEDGLAGLSLLLKHFAKRPDSFFAPVAILNWTQDFNPCFPADP
jgi:hypothetical protein